MINLIVGAGEVGQHLAEILSRESDDVVLIDASAKKLAEINTKLDVGTIHGHGADLKVLSKVDFRKVHMVIAVTDSSEINILVCFYAKQLGNPRTVARVRDPAYLTQGRVRYREKLGVDVTINSDHLCVYKLSEIIEAPGSILVENFAQGKVTVLCVPVKEGSPLEKKTLIEAELPPNMLIAAIERDQQLFIPKGSDTIEAGDRQYVITMRDNISAIEKSFGNRESFHSRVVIYGGTRIGRLLAKALENKGVKVMLIDENYALCQRLAQQLSSAEIVCGDPTDVKFLEEENVDSYDVFFGVTSNEHQNLVAALMAKELGVTKCGIITQRFLTPFLEQLNIDMSISPKFLVSNSIQRMVHKGEIISSATIAQQKGEVLEVLAVKGAGVLNKPLKDLSLPRGILIGAIQHGEEVFIPRGDAQIKDGDHVVIFTTKELLPKVEQYFFPKQWLSRDAG